MMSSVQYKTMVVARRLLQARFYFPENRNMQAALQNPGLHSNNPSLQKNWLKSISFSVSLSLSLPLCVICQSTDSRSRILRQLAQPGRDKHFSVQSIEVVRLVEPDFIQVTESLHTRSSLPFILHITTPMT